MNPHASQGTDDLVWGNISDAELLDVQSEHLLTEPKSVLPGPDSRDGEVSEQRHVASERAMGTGLAVPATAKENRSCQTPKRKRDPASPMERFYRRSLNVTMLCKQTWCEMQAVYALELPLVAKREVERAEVKAGASVHLARELEVHEVVPVRAVTREDRQAINLLNLLGMIPVLQAGGLVRELPVFGVLEGVFMVGVIDELRYSDKGELVLNELKTRRHSSLPGEAQAKGHRLQVGLYKLLFDGLVRGFLTRDVFVEHLRLRLEQPLGAAVLEHAGKLGFQLATLGDLLDILLLNLRYCELPRIDVLRLEYRHQDSGQALGCQDVPFDEDLLRAEIRNLLSYWTGRREPRGVDIEESWRCGMCAYEKHCEWRREQLQGSVTPHTDKKPK
ncbi:exonuclease V [Brienomyrus brachyistius]|uniref:exonuclease V n=1 Tax=Brienomyrus brachyistius TaxID=42636 RepID=UPI0020B19C23|nr:exonuclease V [Brienomyrus brachyistius]